MSNPGGRGGAPQATEPSINLSFHVGAVFLLELLGLFFTISTIASTCTYHLSLSTSHQSGRPPFIHPHPNPTPLPQITMRGPSASHSPRPTPRPPSTPSTKPAAPPRFTATACSGPPRACVPQSTLPKFSWFWPGWRWSQPSSSTSSPTAKRRCGFFFSSFPSFHPVVHSFTTSQQK